jgi:hypothetical protein
MSSEKIKRVVGAVKRRKRRMYVSMNQFFTLWKPILLTKPIRSHQVSEV